MNWELLSGLFVGFYFGVLVAAFGWYLYHLRVVGRKAPISPEQQVQAWKAQNPGRRDAIYIVVLAEDVLPGKIKFAQGQGRDLEEAARLAREAMDQPHVADAILQGLENERQQGN